MRKILATIGIGVMMAFMPSMASAKQTLQEATDSLQNILAEARKGDAVAQNILGGWYYRGRHVDQNYKEAAEWWARSAKQGNVAATGNLGLCYQNGNGVKKDSLTSIKLQLKSIKEGNKNLFSQQAEAAKNGNVFSNMLIAACYEEGNGVKKDINAALPYYQRAAEKNSVEAQQKLGMTLLNAKKYAEAAKWLKKGADNGDVNCSFWYGRILNEGAPGFQANKKEGADYLLRAAEKGLPNAQLYVGNIYMTGDGLTKNAEQAVYWYRLGAGHYDGKDNGITNAQWNLAQCYREGNGTPVNYFQALYWYGEAASRGLKTKFTKLITDTIPNSPFVAYMKGMKAYQAKDFDAALKQFKIVKKAKIADGKVMEGAIYANPDYKKFNLKKGVKLLKEAAKTNSQAMYLLGAMYEAGKGVEKDMTTAIDYLTKAADAGFGPAECALADIYYEGRVVDQDYEKAFALYHKAYQQGELTENAAKRLSNCYKEGKGVEKDDAMAEELLKINTKNHIPDILQII